MLGDQVRFFRSVTGNRLEHFRGDLFQVSGLFRHSMAIFNQKQHNRLNHCRIHLVNQVNRLVQTTPVEIKNVQRLMEINTRNQLKTKSGEIDKYRKLLTLVDPANVLKRGYSITHVNGKLLLTSEDATVGEEMTTTLFKGKVKSKIISKDQAP